MTQVGIVGRQPGRLAYFQSKRLLAKSGKSSKKAAISSYLERIGTGPSQLWGAQSVRLSVRIEEFLPRILRPLCSRLLIQGCFGQKRRKEEKTGFVSLRRESPSFSVSVCRSEVEANNEPSLHSSNKSCSKWDVMTSKTLLFFELSKI